MKRKLFFVCFFVFLMSFIFTVSASAVENKTVYFYSPFCGYRISYIAALDENGEYLISCKPDASGDFHVDINGNEIDLSALVASGELLGAKFIGIVDATPPSASSVPGDFSSDVESWKTGYTLCFAFEDGWSYEMVSRAQSFSDDTKLILSYQPEFYGLSYSVDKDTKVFEIVDCLEIYVTSSLSFDVRVHDDRYQWVYDEYQNEKTMNGLVVDVYGGAAISDVHFFMVHCARAIRLPNYYDVGVSIYDSTTRTWNYKRYASAALTSVASSYELVDNDGWLSLKIVNSSGTSYSDIAFMDNLVYSFDSMCIEDGFIKGGSSALSLPVDLLGREPDAVDGVLTIYVGEPVPVYYFLDDVDPVDATLNDLIQRMSDMIITIPILMLFIVLLPLVSFGVGLLFRIKRT